MPSTAKSSQGTFIRIRTAEGSAKTITGITKANPAVVTSTSHGLANGAIVVVDGIVGMVELNGRAFVVANVATNTFELKGIDSTNYTTYASGGTATPQTMSLIGNVKNFNGFDGSAAEIDVTNLVSTAKEYRLGLQDEGNMSFDLDLDASDTGQKEARAARRTGTVRCFTISLSDGTVAAFMAFVKQFSASGAVDGVNKGQLQCRITNEVSFFA